MVWYFIGVHIIYRTLHGRLHMRNFSSRVRKYRKRCNRRTSFASQFETGYRLNTVKNHQGEDYILVADTLGVNRSTEGSIVARYIRERRIAERPRGRRNNVRVDNEMRDCLNDILSETSLFTLEYAFLQNRGSMNAQW